jgi:hypothetical protein
MIKKIATAALVSFILSIAAPALADPNQDFSVVLKSVMAAHTYRMTMVETNGRTIVMEHVAPDRYHMRSPGSDTYIVGTQGVMIMGGKRTVIPSSELKDMQSDMFAEMAKEAKATSNYTITYLGMQGNQRMYSIVNHEFGNTTTKMWIGPDNLPTHSTSSGNAHLPGTTATYAFNIPMSINLP